MTLYLKYRPRNLDELDLPEVGESLKKIVESGKIPHAFLFAGPKGTGKTSAARILAKIVNCENLKGGTPCDKCEECISITKGNNLDVVEMDAASNRGIDDIRVLRDAVKLAPSRANKKVYIIDEAHMLTNEASNALLKTLEEPPEHVMFILATTNPEKLIDTIKSRATLISFRKAGTKELLRSLERVVKGEKMKVSGEQLLKIAELSKGAFRDAIKMLEQFNLEGESYLEKYKSSDIDVFLQFLAKKDEKMAIEEIEKNVESGMSMENFVEELLEKFHKLLLEKVLGQEDFYPDLSKDDLIILSDIFTDACKSLSDSPIEQLPIEIGVMKWCDADKNAESRRSNLEKVSEVKEIPDVVISKQDSKFKIPDSSIGMVNDDIWKSILASIKPINASIEALLRSSKPIGYDGKTLTLGVFYKFHKERLEDAPHKKILEDTISKILNAQTRVMCDLVEPPPKIIIEESKAEPVLTEGKDKDIIMVAEEIFGN